MAKLYFSKSRIILFSLLALPLSGLADDSHNVLKSTESTYEHVMPLHLATVAELQKRYTYDITNNLPDWAKSKSNTSTPLSFPISFDALGYCNEAHNSSNGFGWIVPESFATTKTGAMLQIKGHYTDEKRNGQDYPSIMGKMSLITNNLNGGLPNRGGEDKNALFSGSMDLRYYLNSNKIEEGTSGKKMTMQSGYFRIRITADVLQKLQNAGLSVYGRNVYYDSLSIVDPYAVFPVPGKDADPTKSKLTVTAPKDWWKNAIILQKSLFNNAVEGYFIHVYTSPDLSDENQTNAVYTGYPTNTDKSGNQTSQVYFQVITGSTDSPTKKLVDKGWDYMTSDAYFYLSASDLEEIRKDDTTVQLIVRDATIRKVSIDPVWQNQMVFHINGTSQTFTKGGTWSDDPSTSTGGTGYINDGLTMQIYNRNVQVLNPQAGDIIRIPVSNIQDNASYQFQLFGYEKATDTSLRMKNLTTSKTSLSTSATEITYTLTAEDVRQINLMQQSGDKAGDPVWYWIALRGQGFKAEGMYFVKNTQNIQIHDVTLDETKETSTIGEEPNVNVTLKRTFTKGQWATLMLPFNLTASQINDAFGPNCQVARFERNDIKVDTTESATHKYQIIYLTSRTHIYANQPMVIKINDDGYSKSSYTFDHVNMTFDNSETGGSYGNGYVQFGEYMVVGTYSLIPQLPKYAVVLLNKINAHHNDGKTRQDFYWVGDNTINNGGKRLKGFRWYMYWGAQDDLKVNFNDAANNDGKYVYSGTDPVSAKVYLDGQPLDDDATTAITGLPKAHVDDDCVFNLQGQYLGRRSKLNLAPGVYIMNGKKVKI